MISAADLARYGLDPTSLRARFDKDANLLAEPERKLIERWKSRAQAGRDWNLTNYKTYLAIDRAWDADFYQTTQTLIGMLKDLVESKNEEQALQVVGQWGMTHLLCVDAEAKTGQPAGKKRLSLPVLYSVILSIPRAYTMMRISRLVNERTSVPLFKYEPAFSSDENRMAGEVITQLVDSIARNLGYSATMAQCVQQCCKYGQQLQFIQEEWYSKKDYDGGPVVGKEGLRYVLPHPSRTYVDFNHPVWTLNTGTGAKYAGYWRVTTFGELRHDTKLWNTDRVKMSYRTQDTAWQIYFQTTGQCSLSHWPANPIGNYVSALDRESNLERPFYTKSQDDQPVWVTNHYETFNPKIDLDDPSLPDTELWLRVMLASDDTPLYVAVLPDRPVNAWLYEPDDSRAIQEGLMLQVIPFGDHLSNLMTQVNLSIKQNLANVVLYDGDVLKPLDVKRDLENPNEAMYRKINYWEFSGKALQSMQKDVTALMHAFKFPAQDITAHITQIGQMLAMLERVVGMSAQEVGSYASHEQTAEEQRVIHQATSQRYDYVAFWIDQAIEAWKSQVYTFYMTFGHAETLAYISSELAQNAEAVGFTVVARDKKGGLMVKAPKTKLRCDAWISQRDGPNRVPWSQLGQLMVQILPGIMGLPALQQDPAQGIKLINMMFESLGFPRGFRIAQPPIATPDVQTYIQQQLAAYTEQVKQFVDAEVGAALDEAMKQVDAKVKAVKPANIQADNGAVVVAHAPDQGEAPEPPPPGGMQPAIPPEVLAMMAQGYQS